MEQVFTCAECCKIYKHFRSLRVHVKKSHPTKLSELAPCLRGKKIFKYSCDESSSNFNDMKHYNYHKRHVHRVSEKSISNLHCPICKEIIPKYDFKNHFEYSHDLTIETDILEFPSFNIFVKWKDDMEKNSKCSFVKNTGAYKTFEITRYYFVCNRSGKYSSKGLGLRRLKLQGSIKIGRFCPAEIIVTKLNNSGKVRIHFTKTHIGHPNELEHITLGADERNLIATEIASNVPFDTILDEVRDSISEDGLQGINLLMKKDILNIANINKQFKHKPWNEGIQFQSHVSIADTPTTSTQAIALPQQAQQKVQQYNKKEKCHIFLARLYELSSKEPKSVERVIRNLIQELVDATVEPEQFCDRLEKLLNVPHQPCIIGFLKESLPLLRQSLVLKELVIDGIRPPQN